MPTKRTKEEQAAYMREYRARQKATTSPHAPQRPVAPPDIHAACDAQIAELREALRLAQAGYGPVGALAPLGTVARETPDEPRGGGHVTDYSGKPTFLAAPDDDCGNCGHPWHNVEDGCRAPDGSIGRQRPCGCKQYHAGPLF